MVRLMGMPFQRAHGIVFVGDGLRVQLGRDSCVMVVGIGQIIAFREDNPAATADARERGLAFRFARL